LYADNLFFRDERKKIILEQERQAEADGVRASVGFANLANIVSTRWKNISPAHKEELEQQAKLEKERYMEAVAAWELEKRSRRGRKEVIDLEADDDEEDDDTASRDKQITTSTDHGFVGEGGSMLYPTYAFFPFPQWLTPSRALTQSDALSQATSMAPNFASTISTINPASYSSTLSGIDTSSFNNARLPFRVETNPQGSNPWPVPQGSLLLHGNMPMPSFQFDGRRNSMPDSFQSERVDPMTNFGVDTTRQQNRRASLFSSVREMDPGITFESNFPPIEEIKRFFNINPETNQVETPKQPKRNS
jgi:hypothetical protein